MQVHFKVQRSVFQQCKSVELIIGFCVRKKHGAGLGAATHPSLSVDLRADGRCV